MGKGGQAAHGTLPLTVSQVSPAAHKPSTASPITNEPCRFAHKANTIGSQKRGSFRAGKRAIAHSVAAKATMPNNCGRIVPVIGSANR